VEGQAQLLPTEVTARAALPSLWLIQTLPPFTYTSESA